MGRSGGLTAKRSKTLHLCVTTCLYQETMRYDQYQRGLMDLSGRFPLFFRLCSQTDPQIPNIQTKPPFSN